jgi:TetR/AcrR family transcriptional regulator, transcriptional repressor for nem operon
VIDQGVGRADATRKQIIEAAAHHFAHKTYSAVSLDDILADADVSKGAMYFHFKSKYALALAIIEQQTIDGRAMMGELLTRQLSGLETLVDVSYTIAVRDIYTNVARAGLNLLESIGRTAAVQASMLNDWIKTLARVVQRAIAEGDVLECVEPEVVARLLVSQYMGLRQTGNLDDPEQFLSDFEKAWAMILPGFANPQRIGYLTEFIRRRTAIAINETSHD